MLVFVAEQELCFCSIHFTGLAGGKTADTRTSGNVNCMVSCCSNGGSIQAGVDAMELLAAQLTCSCPGPYLLVRHFGQNC